MSPSAIVGIKPSATIMEEIRTTIIVKGIDFTNCPITPERKKRGMNTATVVETPAIRGHPNSFIAFLAASYFLRPCSLFVCIPSTITILES